MNQRTIKFRAYDGIKVIPYASQDKMGRLDVSWEGHDTELILMQFTGLTDKKGVWIYEGDIINLDSWEPKVYQIAWDRGAFYIANEMLEEMGDIKYVERSEVIGNIYENGSLLKDK